MTSQAKLEIRRLEATDAKDRAFVDRIVAIINAAYFWSEAEQWTDEKERTSTPETMDLLKSRKLPLVFANEQLASVVKIEKLTRKRRVLGCWRPIRTAYNAVSAKRWLARRKPGPLRKGSAKWRSNSFGPKIQTDISSYYMIETQD